MKEEFPTAAPWIPPRPTLRRLQSAAQDCKGCPLWKPATQTVFGEGAAHARMMLIGEQPGDQEDQRGIPFVGPAGRVLDAALARAGIDRGTVYVTNAVKHFKFDPRGKRRIHKKPTRLEAAACRPWLEAEIAVLRPQVVVCLGSTAAQSLLGGNFRVMASRGTLVPSSFAPAVLATVHPSSLLRAPDDASRQAGMDRFVRDLIVAREALEKASAA